MQKNQIRCKCNNIGLIVPFQYIEKTFFIWTMHFPLLFKMPALIEAFRLFVTSFSVGEILL